MQNGSHFIIHVLNLFAHARVHVRVQRYIDALLRRYPISFFFLAPFRIEAAKTVFAAGQAEVNGRLYDRVFATWGDDGEPAEGVAHYLLWIDAETHLLGFVEFAPRILGRVAQVEYKDLRAVDGMVLPHELSLVDGVGGPLKIHRMKIRKVVAVAPAGAAVVQAEDETEGGAS